LRTRKAQSSKKLNSVQQAVRTLLKEKPRKIEHFRVSIAAKNRAILAGKADLRVGDGLVQGRKIGRDGPVAIGKTLKARYGIESRIPGHVGTQGASGRISWAASEIETRSSAKR